MKLLQLEDVPYSYDCIITVASEAGLAESAQNFDPGGRNLGAGKS